MTNAGATEACLHMWLSAFAFHAVLRHPYFVTMADKGVFSMELVWTPERRMAVSDFISSWPRVSGDP
jgi:hypothetical protein